MTYTNAEAQNCLMQIPPTSLRIKSLSICPVCKNNLGSTEWRLCSRPFFCTFLLKLREMKDGKWTNWTIYKVCNGYQLVALKLFPTLIVIGTCETLLMTWKRSTVIPWGLPWNSSVIIRAFYMSFLNLPLDGVICWAEGAQRCCMKTKDLWKSGQEKVNCMLTKDDKRQKI